MGTLFAHRGEVRLTGGGLSPQHSSVFIVTPREFLINHDTHRHDHRKHHDSTWVTELGPEDLRVSKRHSTCLTTSITVTHPFKERNLRKLEKMARQAASAEPMQHAPISLREQAPQTSPDSPE